MIGYFSVRINKAGKETYISTKQKRGLAEIANP
jgi:hypothetical protein